MAAAADGDQNMYLRIDKHVPIPDDSTEISFDLNIYNKIIRSTKSIRVKLNIFTYVFNSFKSYDGTPCSIMNYHQNIQPHPFGKGCPFIGLLKNTYNVEDVRNFMSISRHVSEPKFLFLHDTQPLIRMNEQIYNDSSLTGSGLYDVPFARSYEVTDDTNTRVIDVPSVRGEVILIKPASDTRQHNVFTLRVSEMFDPELHSEFIQNYLMNKGTFSSNILFNASNINITNEPKNDFERMIIAKIQHLSTVQFPVELTQEEHRTQTKLLAQQKDIKNLEKQIEIIKVQVSTAKPKDKKPLLDRLSLMEATLKQKTIGRGKNKKRKTMKRKTTKRKTTKRKTTKRKTTKRKTKK